MECVAGGRDASEPEEFMGRKKMGDVGMLVWTQKCVAGPSDAKGT